MSSVQKELADEGEDDFEPEVEAIDKKVTSKDNHTSCVSDKIDAVLEVFDEKTCLDLLTNYYKVLKEVTLPPDARCSISGCEYDYSSNTYRLMVVISAASVNIAENFLIVKIDSSTGYPKILSVR